MREYGPSGVAKEIEPAPANTGHARAYAITLAQIKLHEAAALLRAQGLTELPAQIDAVARTLSKKGLQR